MIDKFLDSRFRGNDRVTLAAMLAFAGLLSVAGCGSGGKIAAVVNGQVITSEEVDRRFNRLNSAARASLGNDRRRLIEEVAMETILVQEARRRGLDNDKEVQSLLQEARRQVLLGRLLEVVRQEGSPAISDEEAAQFYEQNKARMIEPETFRASHILVESEEAAKKALSRVTGGEPFAKVAEEVSIDPSKSKGGDIGYFTKGQILPEFEAACQRLKPGEMSSLIKTQLGYHLILLTERRASRPFALDEIRDQIRRQLLAQRQQQKVESFVQQLRAKAQVKIKEPAAPAVSGGSKPGPNPPSASPSQPTTP